MAQRYFDYGLQAELARNYEEAILYYTEAIQNDVDFAMAYYNRGNVYHRQGQSYQAHKDFKIATLLTPSLGNYSKAA